MLAGFRKPIVVTGSQLPLALPRSVRQRWWREGWAGRRACKQRDDTGHSGGGRATAAQRAAELPLRSRAAPLPAAPCHHRTPVKTCWTRCAAPPRPSARRMYTSKRWEGGLTRRAVRRRPQSNGQRGEVAARLCSSFATAPSLPASHAPVPGGGVLWRAAAAGKPHPEDQLFGISGGWVGEASVAGHRWRGQGGQGVLGPGASLLLVWRGARACAPHRPCASACPLTLSLPCPPLPPPPQAFDSLNYPHLAAMGVDVEWNTRAMLNVSGLASAIKGGGATAGCIRLRRLGRRLIVAVKQALLRLLAHSSPPRPALQPPARAPSSPWTDCPAGGRSVPPSLPAGPKRHAGWVLGLSTRCARGLCVAARCL